MTARTYVDAAGVLGEWINSRTSTLVGAGMPLSKGAHFQFLDGAAPASYAYLEELPGTRSADSGENPDMVAVISAQVFGVSRKAACDAAVALAEELSTELDGRPAVTSLGTLLACDDIQGPSWVPDGDLPRLIVQATIRMRP